MPTTLSPSWFPRRLVLAALIGLLVGNGTRNAVTAEQAQALLPPAREIIDKYVAAIGGRAVILKHKSRKAVGKFEIKNQGVGGALQLYGAAPNKALLRVTIPGLGEVVSGFNGEVGWILNPLTGPMLLKGPELEQARDDADFYSMMHDPARFKAMETVGREDFEGRPCYSVKLTRTSGPEDLEYFDVQTGLLAGARVKRDSPIGAVTATHVLSDYRVFGGLNVPTTIVQRMAGAEQVLTLESVEVDTVDAAIFDPPAEIRALMQK